MTKIVGVRFKPAGKIYYFDPAGFEIKKDKSEGVLLENSNGRLLVE